jgi:hypothetical protein
VYDVVITGVRAKDKFRGAAARNVEIKSTSITTAISRPAGRRVLGWEVRYGNGTAGGRGGLQELGKTLKRSFKRQCYQWNDIHGCTDRRLQFREGQPK